MSVHLHSTRQWTAWFLTALALSPFALCFGSTSPTKEYTMSPVTGRLTIAGKPAGDVFLCLDSGTSHCAFGWVKEDGTFNLNSIRMLEGAEPGRYHAHLYTHMNGPKIPAKYRDAKTAGIVLDVASDWNDFQIDLR